MMTESLPARSKEQTQSIEEIYAKHSNMLYWVSLAYMKNEADAEDVVADVFVKLIKTGAQFHSDEHEKAWLLRTAINLCKDNLKHWRRKCVDIDECENLEGENPFKADEILKSVMELPDRCKDAVYLYYLRGLYDGRYIPDSQKAAIYRQGPFARGEKNFERSFGK